MPVSFPLRTASSSSASASVAQPSGCGRRATTSSTGPKVHRFGCSPSPPPLPWRRSWPPSSRWALHHRCAVSYYARVRPSLVQVRIVGLDHFQQGANSDTSETVPDRGPLECCSA
jgi:hypothetical protein